MRRANGFRFFGVLAALLVASGTPVEAQQAVHIESKSPPRFGDYVVEAGDTLRDDLVLMDGTLTVRGYVAQDVVVMDGNVILERGGRVEGDVLVAGGSLQERGGTIGGDRLVHGGVVGSIARRVARVARSEAEAEARGVEREMERVEEEMERKMERMERDIERSVAPSRHRKSDFVDGLEELAATLVFALLLAALGAGLVFYRRENLEVVSDTLRRAPLRAGLVGLAATFLVIPAFVVLVVALAVSIIGIPLLLVAVPLYPLLVAAAAAMGLLASAHALGEKTAEQKRQFSWGGRNSYGYVFTGIGLLLLPLAFASLLEMTGFLSFLGGLLFFLTVLVLWLLTVAGLGAVILTRAGTQGTATSFRQVQDDTDFLD